jgi:lycopene cyclase domain-containing protein
MTYTALALTGFALAVLVDLVVLRTRLLLRPRFYFAWAILVGFQLLTNAWLTGREIVQYSPEAIVGIRVAYAPIEDLAFGAALIILTLSVWTFLSQRERAG